MQSPKTINQRSVPSKEYSRNIQNTCFISLVNQSHLGITTILHICLFCVIAVVIFWRAESSWLHKFHLKSSEASIGGILQLACLLNQLRSYIMWWSCISHWPTVNLRSYICIQQNCLFGIYSLIYYWWKYSDWFLLTISIMYGNSTSRWRREWRVSNWVSGWLSRGCPFLFSNKYF